MISGDADWRQRFH